MARSGLYRRSRAGTLLQFSGDRVLVVDGRLVGDEQTLLEVLADPGAGRAAELSDRVADLEEQLRRARLECQRANSRDLAELALVQEIAELATTTAMKAAQLARRQLAGEPQVTVQLP